MALTVDLITRKKLILVRQLYQRAVTQSLLSQSYVDRILSLIGFDLAVETLLKIVFSSLNTVKDADNAFHILITSTDELLIQAGLPPLPDKAKIKHVHSLRNDAQHKAKYPNETDVGDCRTYVRDFLQQVISNVWGLSLESISLADIVQHPKVKEYLEQAEVELENGEYMKAIIQAEAGFEMTMTLIRSSVVGTMPNAQAFVMLDTFGKTVNSNAAVQVLNNMQETMLLFVVGLEFNTFVHYKQIIRSFLGPISFWGKEWRYQINILSSKTPSQQDTEFAVAYAINGVVQIESRMGDTTTPFGISK